MQIRQMHPCRALRRTPTTGTGLIIIKATVKLKLLHCACETPD